jgi:competence protein ComEC
MIWAALAFAAGICLARMLHLPPAALLLGALLVALVGVPAYFGGCRASLPAAVLVLTALAGALDFAGRAARPHPRDLSRLLALDSSGPRLALVTARVVEALPLPRGGSPGRRLTLAVEAVGSGECRAPAAGRISATLWGEPDRDAPRPGERVRLPLLLRVPGGRRSPGAFDFREYAAARGVWVTGSGRAGLFERLSGAGLSPRAWLARLRESLAALVRREMPAREGPLLNTILLGWRGEMNAEDKLAFTRTGAGHLLAVSGIHVMLLVGAAWWLLRLLGVRPRPAAVVLIVFALAYAQLAGARTPVIRAATMACLLLGGIALGREADGASSLAAAALLILAAWPRELFSVGFQMSFAAVFFIMTAVPALERAWAARRELADRLATDPKERLRSRAARWLRLSIFSSLAAAAGTMPLVVGTFGVISPWAPLVNLFAIPVAGAALAAGLALLVVGGPLPFLAPVPAALAWGALQLLELIVELAGRLPAASLTSDQPPWGLVLGFYVVAAALLCPGLLAARWRARGAVLALTLAIPVSASGLLRTPAPQGIRVTLPDFGRGRAALLETRSGQKCAVWAGGSGRPLIDLLRAERLGSMDRVLLTADQRDVISGAPHLMASGRARRLTIPDGEALSNRLLDLTTGAERVSPGWRGRLGNLELLALGKEAYLRDDGRSAPRPLMILARSRETAVLFADLSNSWTTSAVAREFERRSLRADLVVVGFAWRPGRDSERLLRATGARLALVKLSAFERSESAGARLLAMLRRAGIEPLVTSDLGTLRATLTPDRVLLECYDGFAWRPLGSPLALRPQRATTNACATPAASSR